MTSIFVAKLDFGVSKEQLTELFAQYGSVGKVHLPTDKDTGKPRGFAFVEMFKDDEAAKAVDALDGFEINRRRIAVKVAENRNDRSRPAGGGNRDQRTSGTSVPNKSYGSDQSAQAPSEESKTDPRKKSFKGKTTKSYDSDQGGGGKKAKKMTAHKKSGKNFRYFDDDEPIEGGLFSFDSDDE
jgi:RNA recognition motif-containing protein